LCEDDPDKAECIREVEEAKSNPGINDVQQEGKNGCLTSDLQKSEVRESQVSISARET